jgi:hypothetical protein
MLTGWIAPFCVPPLSSWQRWFAGGLSPPRTEQETRTMQKATNTQMNVRSFSVCFLADRASKSGFVSWAAQAHEGAALRRNRQNEVAVSTAETSPKNPPLRTNGSWRYA